MKVTFVSTDGETFDMLIDGRAGEYGLYESEFADALHRRRVPSFAEVVIDRPGQPLETFRR